MTYNRNTVGNNVNNVDNELRKIQDTTEHLQKQITTNHSTDANNPYTCKYYTTTFTILAADTDKTITIPFDWTNGFMVVHVSRVAGEYMQDDNTAYNRFETSYLALTGTYTLQVSDIAYNVYPLVRNKTDNIGGIPKSATTTSITFDGDGNNTYCKLFVWA